MVTHGSDRRPTRSLAELLGRLRSAQKSNRGAPAYSRWVNRPAGRVLAALSYKLGLYPNQVTLISAAATFSALAVLATVRPCLWSALVIACLLVVGFALDAADGQLARLIGRGRLDGEWLDHVVDSIKSVVLHSCVLISWFRFQHPTPSGWLLVPILYGIQSSVWFFAITLTDQLRGRATEGGYYSRAVVGEKAPMLRSLLLAPADYGVLCLAFILLPFWAPFSFVYSVLMVANMFLLAVALPRWYTEIRSLSGPRGDGDLVEAPTSAAAAG